LGPQPDVGGWILGCYFSLAGVLVIATLRKLASTRQCTVIMTMQQATSHAWPLLDQLCLLSVGTTVYFGSSKGALEVHFTPPGT